MTRRIEYMPLATLKGATRNPKKHDEKSIAKSIARFGYADAVIIDERTGKLVAGHGRVEHLRALQKAGGARPEGVEETAGIGWSVPVQRGWRSTSDAEAEAFIIAHNRIGEAGGWDDGTLAAMLGDISAAGDAALEGVGFSTKEMEKLIESVAPDTLYTKKIESPVYTPKMEKAPPVAKLFDETKADELIAEINATIPLGDVRTFLLAAARRHTVFDYQNIAEFYAHASPDVQRLMERSALVIIDFKQAIDLGFVKLSEDLAEAYQDGE